MAILLALPTASQFDPAESSEGSLDPLGLYPISEVLASRIGSPGVRERHRNLRFLTICCVGWEVMASVPHIEEPGDPSATLEQAFEWLVVEALTSGAGDAGESFQGLPGATKARACIEAGVHLNADRYLRMASVFGFYGVYRTLAEYLRMVARDSEQLPVIDESGANLLNVWRREQGLPGFGRSLSGPGQREYQALVKALTNSWKQGQGAPERGATEFIQRFLKHGDPIAPCEAAELKRAFVDGGRDEADENRREVLSGLKEAAGRRFFEEAQPDSESQFHRWLLPRCGARLKAELEAVRAYEGFAIELQGLFDDLLFAVSKKPGLTGIDAAAAMISDLARKTAALSEAYLEATRALQRLPGLGARFERAFSRFGARFEGVACIRQLLEHHEAVQKAKPPNGKAAWLERADDRIAVRLRYQREAPAPRDGRYVSFYRSRPLFDLLKSLERSDGAT